MWKTGKKYIEGIYYDSEEVDYDSVPDFRESIYSRDNIGVFKEEPTTSIPVSQDIGGIPQDIRSGYIKDLTLTGMNDGFKKGIYERNLMFNKYTSSFRANAIPYRKRSPIKSVTLVSSTPNRSTVYPIPQLPKTKTRYQSPTKTYTISKIMV